MDPITDEIFCDLMDQPFENRLSALDAMADLSDERKNVIRGMLVEAAKADDYFTGTCVVDKMVQSPSLAERDGDMCGPYKLVSKLGEGGFGVVWLSEQEMPLRRTVAVKVLKAGMDTLEVLARFDAEKQALARMNHPNIAKVLDAGMTELGRPYFVMELVKGKPITRYCQERGIGVEEILRLFCDVCAAVGHAHQKGVIHRDIKPSNVIVTETESVPVVKVIDFGIAKAIEGSLTDKTLFTSEEQWIGTPAYMSPEQAGLASVDVDTRSDIYSLGVLLYELIADVAPFDSRTLMKAGCEEMRRIIREVDPPRPSVRIATASKEAPKNNTDTAHTKKNSIKSISNELDWIVMRAMEKSRDRRYESAAALADDVFRYLSDKPVEARPPSSLYLLGKFVRRHRRSVVTATLFSIMLVVAVVYSTLQAVRARRAEGLANLRLQEVISQRNAKDSALKDSESVTRLLAEIFKRPNPGVDGRKVTVAEALDAASYKLDGELMNQPDRHAMLLDVLAGTYEDLGLDDAAIALKSKAVSIRRKNDLPLNGPKIFEDNCEEQGDSNSEFLRKQWNDSILSHGENDERAIRAQCDYAMAITVDPKFAQKGSFEILQGAYDKARSVLGRQHHVTMIVQTRLARLMHSRGMKKEAIELYANLVDSFREKDGALAETTIEIENEFIDYVIRNDPAYSRTNFYREFVATCLQKRTTNFGSDHIQTARLHFALANHLLFDRDYVSGLDHAERALSVIEREFGSGHRYTVAAMEIKAIHLAALGRVSESMQVLNLFCSDTPENIQSNTLLSVLQIWTNDFVGYNQTRRTVLKYLNDQCEKAVNMSKSSLQDQAWKNSIESKHDILEPYRNGFIFTDTFFIACMCVLAPLEDPKQGELLLNGLKLFNQDLPGLIKPRMPASMQAMYARSRAFIRFRMNDFEGAMRDIKESARLVGTLPADQNQPVQPSDLFVEAMTLYKLGEVDAAKKMFLRGEGMLPVTDFGSPPFEGMYFYSPLQPVPWILHSEALSLIETRSRDTK